ncbi:hypothetical protein WH292_08750 [Enterobacter sp. MYb186]
MIDLTEHYSILKPKYDGLLSAIKFSLHEIIKSNNLSLFELDGRVKTLDSVKDKLLRKNYENGINDIEDLCGLRIVCYYTTDMDRLSDILASEFNVLSESDKQKEAEDDRFGYLSRHFIVTLKEEWLSAPLYRDYRDLKIEIQLRTMLMHTWAAISHKLLYKYESDAPKELKRRLNRLSALIELADEQFNTIRELKDNYAQRLLSDTEDKNIPLNSDSVLSLVNKYSPGRSVDDADDVPKFLGEIYDLELSVADFELKIIEALPLAAQIEKQLAKIHGKANLPLWSVLGFCRIVLDLTSDAYFHRRWEGGPLDELADGSDDTDDYWKTWRDLVKSLRATI